MRQTRRQFVRTLFVATQAAVLSPVFAPKMFAADAKADTLNFLLIGDWGRNGEPDQMAVATQMGIYGEQTKAKFVVSVGDNFYEDGLKSATDPQWQSSFEKVYTAPSLQVPWWVILGNHDYHGNCDAQIEYSKTSPRWNMPARYFTRTEKIDANNAVDFFYIDTTPMAELDDDEKMFEGNVNRRDIAAQVAWLDAALAASTVPWKIVIGHHPVYSGGQHGDTPYIIEHILPLMEKYGVQAYFNGHDHDLQHLQSGKINFFCTGGGSKPRANIKKIAQTKFSLGCSGFIAASLSADALDVRMIDDKGKVIYATSAPRQA
ncbi:MAG TPA: tartrate-resistant acid phosphatase type 5 family protein [Verrucomicrobiae bacterium]|nr:tartrate-resistant acid phosphatase type 5 family protein [Verrucomicrobiae bacterium]